MSKLRRTQKVQAHYEVHVTWNCSNNSKVQGSINSKPGISQDTHPSAHQARQPSGPLHEHGGAANHHHSNIHQTRQPPGLLHEHGGVAYTNTAHEQGTTAGLTKQYGSHTNHNEHGGSTQALKVPPYVNNALGSLVIEGAIDPDNEVDTKGSNGTSTANVRSHLRNKTPTRNPSLNSSAIKYNVLSTNNNLETAQRNTSKRDASRDNIAKQVSLSKHITEKHSIHETPSKYRHKTTLLESSADIHSTARPPVASPYFPPMELLHKLPTGKTDDEEHKKHCRKKMHCSHNKVRHNDTDDGCRCWIPAELPCGASSTNNSRTSIENTDPGAGMNVTPTSTNHPSGKKTQVYHVYTGCPNNVRTETDFCPPWTRYHETSRGGPTIARSSQPGYDPPGPSPRNKTNSRDPSWTNSEFPGSPSRTNRQLPAGPCHSCTCRCKVLPQRELPSLPMYVPPDNFYSDIRVYFPQPCPSCTGLAPRTPLLSDIVENQRLKSDSNTATYPKTDRSWTEWNKPNVPKSEYEPAQVVKSRNTMLPYEIDYETGRVKRFGVVSTSNSRYPVSDGSVASDKYTSNPPTKLWQCHPREICRPSQTNVADAHSALDVNDTYSYKFPYKDMLKVNEINYPSGSSMTLLRKPSESELERNRQYAGNRPPSPEIVELSLNAPNRLGALYEHPCCPKQPPSSAINRINDIKQQIEHIVMQKLARPPQDYCYRTNTASYGRRE